MMKKSAILTVVFALVTLTGQAQHLPKLSEFPKISFPKVRMKPASRQEIEASSKLQDIKSNMLWVGSSYESIDRELKGSKYEYAMDTMFEDITFKNKEIDKQWKEFFKLLKNVDIPSNEAPQLYDRFYNVILKFYAEQSKEISNFYQEYGAYTKEARKAQKTVVKLADKYKKKRNKTLKKIS